MADVVDRPTLLLSEEELIKITGAKQVGRQRRALIALGVPYRETAAGLLVSRAAAEDWLRGQSTAPRGRPGGPRFDLVR